MKNSLSRPVRGKGRAPVAAFTSCVPSVPLKPRSHGRDEVDAWKASPFAGAIWGLRLG